MHALGAAVRKCDGCGLLQPAASMHEDPLDCVAYLKSLIREALDKGAERRCPWCWKVALRGRHAPDCRAIEVVGRVGAPPADGNG